jgi:hypothetical protein
MDLIISSPSEGPKVAQGVDHVEAEIPPIPDEGR